MPRVAGRFLLLSSLVHHHATTAPHTLPWPWLTWSLLNQGSCHLQHPHQIQNPHCFPFLLFPVLHLLPVGPHQIIALAVWQSDKSYAFARASHVHGHLQFGIRRFQWDVQESGQFTCKCLWWHMIYNKSPSLYSHSEFSTAHALSVTW